MQNSFLVGTRKGMQRFSKINGQWQAEPMCFPGVRVPMVLHDPRSGSFYAAVEHGHFGSKLHCSTDGIDWQEIGTPTYPERPADVPPLMDPWRKKEIPWSLEMIWALETGGAEEPGVLWCGTIPGGLFVSRNHGASWELVRPLWDEPERSRWAGGGYDFPGIHSISVDPRDSRKITVAVSCGGIWQTADGGNTWKVVGLGQIAEFLPPEQSGDPVAQDPHRLVHCPGQPDTFWNQHHNGIFKSTDGAETFSRITTAEPSDFGFAVAVHPENPDIAWFAPGVKDEKRYPVDGKLVVSRTTDGGKTFQTFGTGLPGENAWHLIYRHGLEVEKTGQRLIMGSTTGSLWLSEDAGESWERLTAELPPIFCVRWI